MIFGISHSFVVKEILKSLSNNSNFMNISRYVFKDTNELIYYCWSIKKAKKYSMHFKKRTKPIVYKRYLIHLSASLQKD